MNDHAQIRKLELTHDTSSYLKICTQSLHRLRILPMLRELPDALNKPGNRVLDGVHGAQQQPDEKQRHGAGPRDVKHELRFVEIQAKVDDIREDPQNQTDATQP